MLHAATHCCLISLWIQSCVGSRYRCGGSHQWRRGGKLMRETDPFKATGVVGLERPQAHRCDAGRAVGVGVVQYVPSTDRRGQVVNHLLGSLPCPLCDTCELEVGAGRRGTARDHSHDLVVIHGRGQALPLLTRVLKLPLPPEWRCKDVRLTCRDAVESRLHVGRASGFEVIQSHWETQSTG